MVIDLVMVTAPKPPGSKHVDLAGRSGLGDGAGEGLARRGAAARIGVVADAGDPGARRLRVRRGGEQREAHSKDKW